MRLEIPSRRGTRHLGAALAPSLRVGDVVWLEGELGAGKTFFARGLLRALGVSETIPVTSPTFALMHEHEASVPVRHLDLYRLGHGEELRELGIDEALDEAVVLIEWGARFRASIGERGIELWLGASDDGGRGREARLTGLDARGRELLEATCADPRVRSMCVDEG